MMDELRIDLARLRGDIEELARIGRADSGGLMRAAFSPAFEEARAWLTKRMADTGLEVRGDAAGNVIGRLGTGSQSVLSGSHIDAVPDGGPLDGALGVLAALECARAIAEAGLDLPRAFEAIAFADEEGRFIGCLGSRAMTGGLSADDVGAAADFEGNSLADALRSVGLDPERVGEAARPADEIAAYVELHIEQGPVLEHAGIPIGVVEAIVGLVQDDLCFQGEPDHAGTTPMDLRKDAFMGAAIYAGRARELVLAEGSEHARLTFGIVETKPQAANIVPYEARLRQEIRDVSPEVLDRLVNGTRSLAEEVAAEHRLDFSAEGVFRNEPARMAPEIQDVIRQASAGLGLSFQDMPSGAGHDAQLFAPLVPTGMIFVPSKGGRSHRPDEWTDWPALENGANVLLHTLVRLLRED
jgi:N-carbamoyl-L-amino-acid hydrolase